VCIFIKCAPSDKVFEHVKRTYVDVVDSYGVIPWLRNHPTVTAIAISQIGVDYLKNQLGRDNVVFVPEHHCNFENVTVNVHKPTVVGFCGYNDNFHLDFGMVEEALKPLGLQFIWLTDFEGSGGREKVCRFYRAIDIHLTFRRDGGNRNLVPAIKNPLKLANAGSFGVPTVGFPEVSYVDEWDGCFMPAHSLDELLMWCDRLVREPKLYQEMSGTAIRRAADYHIDVIVEKYKELLDGSVDNL
jgi:hypothetical protein